MAHPPFAAPPGQARARARAREDSRRFVERFRARIVRDRPIAPGEPVRWVLHVNPLRRAEDREWIVEGLARAGLTAP